MKGPLVRTTTSRASRSLRTIVVTAALTLATFAVAQQAGVRPDHPETYVVKRGDTLWDIAGRFLKRPWLWPEIWQANPQVKNPHLIYPGDVLSLAYINRLGDPRQAAVPGIALAEVEPWLKDLRVTDDYQELPHVVAIEDDRLRATQRDVVYVRELPASAVGQRFLVVRPTAEFMRLDSGAGCCDTHYTDELDVRGDKVQNWEQHWTALETPRRRNAGTERLGYELQRVNVGTVTRGEVGGIQVSTLRLDSADREVRAGDRLIPVDVQPYDPYFYPHPPKTQFEYRHAQVLAVADRMKWGGPRDVVALSVGSADGVDNGTVFSLWRMGRNIADPVEYRRDTELVAESGRVRLPDEFSGHVMVFRTFKNVSYGLVMDSIKPSRVGYELKHPDAAY